jgi:trigger factor
VQFGDLLSLNVWGAIEGEQAINDQGIDFIPRLDNPEPIPGFSVYLEGMSEGQEKEFTLTVPQAHHQHPYAGKECHLRVQVLSVKEKKLPELDDEFAKGIRDGYESLEALRSYVRQRLTEAAEDASLRQLEQESLQELLKGATIQVSQLIYQRELDTLYENRQRALSNQRLDLDTYLSVIGKSQEEWLAQLRPQAEERLNTFLVLRKIAEEEGFNISHEEIQGEMDSILSTAGDARESVQRTLSTENAQDSIRTSLLNRKVMGRLVEIVQGHSGQGEPQAGAAGAVAGVVDTPPSQESQAETSLPDPEGTNEGAQSHAV